MLNIKNWMDEMRLKMNPSKTEFIYFRFAKQLTKCNIHELNVAGDLIQRTDLIHYLGVWLDAGLTYKHHITKKCQAAMVNFMRIRSIRHLLDTDTTASLCLSLCISHIDYCNSLLYGIPQSSLKKLQRVQNMCARLVLRRSKTDSATSCLRDLHWLPVKYRIHYNGIGPGYLQQMIVKHHAKCEGLKSAQHQDLLVSRLQDPRLSEIEHLQWQPHYYGMLYLTTSGPAVIYLHLRTILRHTYSTWHSTKSGHHPATT